MSLDNSNLNSLTKKELIELINGLRTENSVLKELQTYMNQSNERLEKLEREQNRHIQYQMRDTIEISGIPTSVKQNDLEGEVLKIFETAGVEVNGYKLDYYHIQACHRIGKKGVTICKFVNRKFANNAIYSGKNLKVKELYGTNSGVYINSSLCKEYGFLNFQIRNAKKQGKIFRWKLKHGVNLIQVQEGNGFTEISHKNDLIKLGIINE